MAIPVGSPREAGAHRVPAVLPRATGVLVVGIPLIWWAASITCDPGDDVCMAESWGRGFYVVFFAAAWVFLTSTILIARAVAEVGRAVRSRRAGSSEPSEAQAPATDSPAGSGRAGSGGPPGTGPHGP
ncbi:hypothetical protein GCM10027517_38690 [Phycicoccus ginsengisoli]